MTCRLPCDGPSPALRMEDACRVLDVLGPMPAEALAAMVDYGLSDAEIGRYFDLSADLIETLRQHWEIAGAP